MRQKNAAEKVRLVMQIAGNETGQTEKLFKNKE
jgi:hypothetical protein